jgi:hypothetical protein
MKGSKKVIQALNKLLAGELTHPVPGRGAGYGDP